MEEWGREGEEEGGREREGERGREGEGGIREGEVDGGKKREGGRGGGKEKEELREGWRSGGTRERWREEKGRGESPAHCTLEVALLESTLERTYPSPDKMDEAHPNHQEQKALSFPNSV